jgi:hypothetical protein
MRGALGSFVTAVWPRGGPQFVWRHRRSGLFSMATTREWGVRSAQAGSLLITGRSRICLSFTRHLQGLQTVLPHGGAGMWSCRTVGPMGLGPA